MPALQSFSRCFRIACTCVFAAVSRRIAAIGGKVDRRSLFGHDVHFQHAGKAAAWRGDFRFRNLNLRTALHLDLLRSLHGHVVFRVADGDLRVGGLQRTGRAAGIVGNDLSRVILIDCVHGHAGLIKALALNVGGLFGGRRNADTCTLLSGTNVWQKGA